MADTLKRILTVSLAAAALTACDRNNDETQTPASSITAQQVLSPAEQARQDAADKAKQAAEDKAEATKLITEDKASRAQVLAAYPNIHASDLYLSHHNGTGNPQLDRYQPLEFDHSGITTPEHALCETASFGDGAERSNAAPCNDISRGRYEVDLIGNRLGLTRVATIKYYGKIGGVDDKGNPSCVYTGDDTEGTCESVMEHDADAQKLKSCLEISTGLKDVEQVKGNQIVTSISWGDISNKYVELNLHRGGRGAKITYSIGDVGNQSVAFENEYYMPSTDKAALVRTVRPPSQNAVFACLRKYRVRDYK